MKFLDLSRFVEMFNDMFNHRLCSLICDWDAKNHKQDMNNHANPHGMPEVLYDFILTSRVTTHVSSTTINFDHAPLFHLCSPTLVCRLTMRVLVMTCKEMMCDYID